MKKYLLIALASLFAFASCSKESNETPEVKDENTVNLTFTSKRPQLKSESKTAWDGSTIVWSEGDKIRVGYTLNGNWMGKDAEGTAKFFASNPVSIDETNKNVGTFNVPISSSAFTDPEISGQYQFFSIYPSNILESTVNNPEAQSITLPAAQHIVSGTFDSGADVMLGQSSSLSLSGLPTVPISLSWTRLVAHADLTFSNIAFEGTEIVSKITLTFNEEAKVAGSFSVNFVDGTASAGSTNVLTLSSDEGIASSSSSFKAWACVLPVTFTSLDVEIKTDKATYTRSISGISKTFKQNSRNTLTINMSTATRTAAAQYEWVEKDLSEITSSDVFVIVGNNGGTYAMSNENGTSSAPSAVHVTVSDSKLSAAPSETIQWTLSKDGSNYTFYPYGSTTTWLYCNTTAQSSSNNNMRVGTGNRKAFVLDNNNYLVTNDTYTDRYISVYNGEDWRGYVSKTNTVSFYVKTSPDTRADAELSFTETSFNVNVGDDFTAPTLTNPHNVAVTYSSSNENLAVVDENTGEVVIGDNPGTVTIAASFAGNTTYKPGTASYTINITDPNGNDGSAEKPYTASDAKAAAEGGSTDEVYVKGIISSIATAYNSQYENISFYISEDGNDNTFEIFRASATSENDFKKGDYVIFKGNLTMYNTTAELAQGSTLIAQVKAPGFTPDGGSFTGESQSVTLSADAGSTIYYTTDGSTPTTASAVYSTAISISETTIIKAFAVKDGNTTGIVERTFTKTVPSSSTTATITFGNSGVKINAASVTGRDSGENTWTITTEGTTSFTLNDGYSQVGSSKNPATSITFTTTLPSSKKVTNMSAKFGGFSGTAGTVTLKVGDSSIGSGSLSGSSDVTVTSTTTANGTVLTVTVTGISKGVKVYNISVTYE